MKKAKHILFSILILIAITIIYFVTSLFLGMEGHKIASVSVFLTVPVLFIYGLICIITGKSKIPFIKGRFRAFIFLILVSIIAVNFVIISALNAALISYFGEDTSAFKRLKLFSNTAQDVIRNKGDEINISKMTKEASGRITFYYNGSEKPQKSIDTINGALKRAESACNLIIGKTSETNFNVVFTNKEVLEDISFLKKIDGLYAGKEEIYVRPYKETSQIWQYEGLFIHEYSHYKLEKFAQENDIKNDIPHWFNEGLAEYMRYDKRQAMEVLDKIYDFRKLNTSFDFEAARENYDPYSQSYYAIDKIIQMKGKGAINEILLALKEKEFYEAFESVVGVNIETFQEKYLKERVNQANQKGGS